MSSCKTHAPGKNRIALIHTDYGDIKIKLYNETPKHRDNFVKLTDEGFYDDLLFHRVINGFMIQGGDPKSTHAPLDIPLGGGGPGYTIPSEIVYHKYFHKRGAVAAARQPDRFNPERASSGSQFYIVQGVVYDTLKLKEIAIKRNDKVRGEIFNRIVEGYRDSIQFLMYSQMKDKIKELQDTIMAQVDREFLKTHKIFTFNDEQIKTYTTIGGAPFLDGQYTVFGEVIDGMSVVDSIAKVQTNNLDRPLKDIHFDVKMLN